MATIKHKSRVNQAVFTMCGYNSHTDTDKDTDKDTKMDTEKGTDAVTQSPSSSSSSSSSSSGYMRVACVCDDRTLSLYDLEGKQVKDFLTTTTHTTRQHTTTLPQQHTTTPTHKHTALHHDAYNNTLNYTHKKFLCPCVCISALADNAYFYVLESYCNVM